MTLTILIGLNLASAAPLISMQSLLERPVDSRVNEFRKLGPRGAAFLRQTAFSAHDPLALRWRAVTTMGRLDSAGFRADIDRALTSSEWFLRNSALIALLSDDDRAHAVQWSIKLLQDAALVVRTQAVRNIIALDAREAEPELWRALQDRRNFVKGKESLWIRAHIAEALSRFAGPGRAKAFERMLLDNDERLHKWAVNGLEAATGLRMSDRSEAVEVRRRQWLARLGVQEI